MRFLDESAFDLQGGEVANKLAKFPGVGTSPNIKAEAKGPSLDVSCHVAEPLGACSFCNFAKRRLPVRGRSRESKEESPSEVSLWMEEYSWPRRGRPSFLWRRTKE